MFESRYELDSFMAKAIKSGASDIHLGQGREPKFRIQGRLVRVEGVREILTEFDMENLIHHAKSSSVAGSTILSGGDDDFVYEFSKEASFNDFGVPRMRFRVNASADIRGLVLVFRTIPNKIPQPEDLGLPKSFLSTLETQRHGLVLVTGPTGSGKTTSLASGIDNLLKKADDSIHLLTLENPVEFVYNPSNYPGMQITQRELYNPMESFTRGMKSALRQDPDMILVGEMRDIETVRLAFEAAETGHLVMATGHTSKVASTVSRFVQMFSAEEQPAARAQMINSLQMIMGQALVQSTDGKRVAVREELVFSPEMRKELLLLSAPETYIRLDELVEMKGVSMAKSLLDLLEKKRITEETYLVQMKALE